MAGPFSIQIEGMSELLASFKTVEEGMLNFRQLGAWKGVQSEFYKIQKAQFGSEGSAGKSGKWQALSPGYAKAKQKRYGSRPILTASGTLYKSLTSANASGAVVEMTAQELTLGTSVKYVGYHQRGTKRMPRREPISFTNEQEKQLMKPIQDKLKQLIANAKLTQLRGF
jgi:phage gpG-like protein